MKRCNRCQVEKRQEEFARDRRRSDGLFIWCRECNSNHYKRYWKNGKYKQKRLDWYEKNRDKRLFHIVKSRAKKQNLDFDLSPEDIIIPEVCPYLGIKLTSTQGQGRLQSNASVDRIDNTKGYVKGNVQVISRVANAMKNKATIDELVTFARNILKIHGEMAEQA